MQEKALLMQNYYFSDLKNKWRHFYA